jgi:hypothetical protein
MAKILWTYRDVTKFLEGKRFDFYEDLEHSQSWVKLGNNGEPERFVEIKYTQPMGALYATTPRSRRLQCVRRTFSLVTRE